MIETDRERKDRQNDRDREARRGREQLGK